MKRITRDTPVCDAIPRETSRGTGRRERAPSRESFCFKYRSFGRSFIQVKGTVVCTLPCTGTANSVVHVRVYHIPCLVLLSIRDPARRACACAAALYRRPPHLETSTQGGPWARAPRWIASRHEPTVSNVSAHNVTRGSGPLAVEALQPVLARLLHDGMRMPSLTRSLVRWGAAATLKRRSNAHGSSAATRSQSWLHHGIHHGTASQSWHYLHHALDHAVAVADVRRRHKILSARLLVPPQPAQRSNLREGAAAHEEDESHL